MPVFKELDPDVARKLIEGYEDEVTPDAAKLDAFYRQFKCPTGCAGSLMKEFAANHAFANSDTLTPRSLLRCTSCQLLLDPHTGLVVEAGNRVDVGG